MKVSLLNAKTHYKKVKGFITNDLSMKIGEITVRGTNDDSGRSISFADDKGKVMLHVAYEDIEDIIKFLQK